MARKRLQSSSRVKVDLSIGDIVIKDVTQRTVALLGMKGSGKTTALRQIMRAAEAKGLPVIAVDPTGALVSKDFFNIRISGSYNVDYLAEIVNAAWGQKAPLVLETSDMRNAEMVRFAQLLFSLLEKHRDGLVIIDEIPDMVPQYGNKSDEIIRFNRKCRNRNVGFIFTTQRPAAVDKNVLALADMLLVMRIAWPADVEVYEEHLKNMNIPKEKRQRILTEIAHFGPGEVYVLDFLAR